MNSLEIKDPTPVQNMTLVNIFVNITTEALEKTFWLLTGNLGIQEKIRPKINMKNESKQAPLELLKIFLNAGTKESAARNSSTTIAVA